MHIDEPKETTPPQGTCHSFSSTLREHGLARLALFEQHQVPLDLEVAIQCLRQAASSCHSRGHVCPDCLDELGWGIYVQDAAREAVGTSSESLQLLDCALHLRIQGDLGLSKTLSRMGAIFTSRAKHRRNITDTNGAEREGYTLDIDNAIQAYRKALLDQRLSPDQRDNIICQLVAPLGLRINRSKKIDDIREMIVLQGEVLARCSDGHPGYNKAMISLLRHLSLLYEQTGKMEDLNAAIDLAEKCAGSGVPSHPSYVEGTLMAALVWQHRFEHQGDIQDLEKALLLFRSVVLHAKSSASLMKALRYLALCFMLSFKHSGRRSDLDEAIDLARQGCHWFHRGHVDRPMSVVFLGMILRVEHEVFTSVSSLDESISWYESLGSAAVDDTYYHSEVLSQYGGLLRIRHQQQNSHLDSGLDRAIMKLRRALELRPPPSRFRHETLQELALALAAKYSCSKDESKLAEAIELQREAVFSLSPINLDRCAALAAFARLHLVGGEMQRNLTTCVDLLIQGLQDSLQRPQLRLFEAVDTLQMLESVPPMLFKEAVAIRLLEAYAIAVDLLPQVAFSGQDLQTRISALARANTLVISAALRALLLSRSEMAIELLEHGRAVFWAQHLRLRIRHDWHKLGVVPAYLISQINQTALELRHSVLQYTVLPEPDNYAAKLHTTKEMSRARALGEEFERLIPLVRSCPGMEKFLTKDSFAMLSSAVGGRTTVFFLASNVGCYALVLQPGNSCERILSIPLSLEWTDLNYLVSRLSQANSRESMRQRMRGMKTKFQSRPSAESNALEILEVLWIRVMAPVVTNLRYTKQSGRDRPRLWVCPTGAFSHLPLHSAGNYTINQPECCSNYFVSSYVPSLGALRDATISSKFLRKADATVVAAAVSHAFRYSTLQCVDAEVEEISRILARLRPSCGTEISQHTYSPVQICTRIDEILAATVQAPILHMACHGKQDNINPLNSGFAMADGMLTMAQLMSLSLDHALFAFLSACETAKSDPRDPDQAIHLAAAMMCAGYKSVIGTLWSMNDYDGPLVAKTVYSALYSGDSEFINLDDIPYALDDAVKKLQAQKVHVSRWALYVHFGA